MYAPINQGRDTDFCTVALPGGVSEAAVDGVREAPGSKALYISFLRGFAVQYSTSSQCSTYSQRTAFNEHTNPIASIFCT
jgi:hypothetical protein